MTITRTCQNCGNNFDVSPYLVKAGKAQYCTRLCFKTHKRPISVRFFKYVDKEGSNGCWEWTGSKMGGYGGLGWYVRNEDGLAEGRPKSTRAHRISWELHNGPIPDGLCVLHYCDNPSCVNPDHLFLGTLQDNMDDRNKKHRQASGAKHGRARLTELQVLTIRLLSKEGMTHVAISEKLSIPRTTVRYIANRQTWKDGPFPD